MLSKSRLKYIQTLGQKKFRLQEGCFLAEGPKLVAELLTEKRSFVLEIFAMEEWMTENQQLIGATACSVISEQELEKISQLNTPNQVLAVVKQFEHTVPVLAEGLILALDTIQDPGNLGTIIRIADWFGIQQIVCSEETAECYNPKVVQATMGSIARVGVCYTRLEEWLATQSHTKIYAAVLEGQDIRKMNPLKEGILLIGNESKGISPALLEMANQRISIPQKGKAESLNAAVAAGIILSHLVP
jgi:TrmH family RNA methyltransferase